MLRVEAAAKALCRELLISGRPGGYKSSRWGRRRQPRHGDQQLSTASQRRRAWRCLHGLVVCVSCVVCPRQYMYQKRMPRAFRRLASRFASLLYDSLQVRRVTAGPW